MVYFTEENWKRFESLFICLLCNKTICGETVYNQPNLPQVWLLIVYLKGQPFGKYGTAAFSSSLAIFCFCNCQMENQNCIHYIISKKLIEIE